MTNAYVVGGTVRDGTTIVLDTPLPVSGGRVKVTIEVLASPPTPKETLQECIDGIHRRRAEAGVQPLTEEQIREWIEDIRYGRGH